MCNVRSVKVLLEHKNILSTLEARFVLKNHLTATYTSALKIVPLVVRVYIVGFVKCFGIAVFCFILNQSGQL